MSFFNVPMVQEYSSTETATPWKKFHFILSERSDFLWIDNMSIAVHAFGMRMLKLLLLDERWLQRYVNKFVYLSNLPLIVKMFTSCLKRMRSVLFVFMKWIMLPAACSRLWSRDSDFCKGSLLWGDDIIVVFFPSFLCVYRFSIHIYLSIYLIQENVSNLSEYIRNKFTILYLL